MTGHYSGIIHTIYLIPIIPKCIYIHACCFPKTNFLFALADNTNVRILFVPWPVYYIYTYIYACMEVCIYVCVYVYIMYRYLYDLMRAACASGKNSVERKKPKSTEGCFDGLFFLWFPFILPFFSANYYWYKNNRSRYTSRTLLIWVK